MAQLEIKIAVVEDSDIDAATCLEFLNRYASDRGHIFHIDRYPGGNSFLTKFKSQYDFIIFDVQLGDRNGIDVAKEVRKVDEEVIIMFETNLGKYATSGYEVAAIDYVLKPLNYASLSLKLDRVMRQLSRHDSGASIVVKMESGYAKVNVDDVFYLEIFGHDIVFHESEKKTATYGTLKEYESMLSNYHFLRCNSCYLVNAAKIMEIKQYDLLLSNGETIKISHPRRKEFVNEFKRYMMEKRGQFDMVQWYFAMFFSFATEMLIGLLMLLPRQPKFRKYPWLRIPASLALIYGTSYLLFYLTTDVVQWSIGWNIALYSIFIVVIYFGWYNVFNTTLRKNLLLVLIAYSFQHMVYQFGQLVLQTGLSAYVSSSFPRPDNWIGDLINAILQVVVYASAFAAIYFFIARHFHKVAKSVFSAAWAGLYAVALYLVIVVANVYVTQYTNWQWMRPLKIVLSLVFIFVCLMFNFVIFWGFRYAAAAERNAALESSLNARLSEHMKNEQNMNFINIKCHDLRKRIRAFRARGEKLSDEDFDLLEQSLYLFDTGIRTGNSNIDALIQEKQLYCRSHGIEFTSLIDGSAFAEMDYSDIYFLFMNIIDNAIEATEGLSDDSLKTISLTAQKTQGVILIECVNYFEGERKIGQNGRLLTTKEDKKHHGFGNQSIRYIVEKYKGNVSYDITDNVFTLKIVI